MNILKTVKTASTARDLKNTLWDITTKKWLDYSSSQVNTVFEQLLDITP